MSVAEHWPTAVDYQTALQAPTLCFNALALKQGQVLTDTLGLPLVATGNVVAVFRMHLAEGDVALRCFTRKISFRDLAHRYKALRLHLDPNALPALVPCLYRRKEVLVRGVRYPVIQMPWVPGLPLHRFIEEHLQDAAMLGGLADQWAVLMAQLRAADFAHGDLSDGNVLVDRRGAIRLIDYDGAFVPALREAPSDELGKPNYQHPARLDPRGPDYGYYAPNLDAFAALVVYLSLRALAEDPERWTCYHTGENLIFDQEDFKNPGYTPIWLDLRSGQHEEVKRLTHVLESFCRAALADLPDLERAMQGEMPPRRVRVQEPVEPTEPVEPDVPGEAPASAPPPEAPALVAEDVAVAVEPLPGQMWRHKKVYLSGVGVLALVAVLLVLLVRGPKNEARGSISLSPPPETTVAYLKPDNLAGFYTGYATSLDGDREPMALIIDSVAVDSLGEGVRFHYSVNWKEHYIGGLGRYNTDTGHVDLESHYVLYVARATEHEVVLASLSHRDQRPLVLINKRVTP